MPEVFIARGVDAAEGPAGMMRAGGAQTAGRFDFMVSTIPYFAGPPLHVHDEQDDRSMCSTVCSPCRWATT